MSTRIGGRAAASVSCRNGAASPHRFACCSRQAASFRPACACSSTPSRIGCMAASGISRKYYRDWRYAQCPLCSSRRGESEVLGHLMHIKKIAIAASVTLLAAASARAEDNKACVSKATEALPRITGLVIKKTRTRPVPASILATWQGQTRPIIVDGDIVATGAAEPYSYICVLPHGAAYVRGVMI